MNRWLISIVSLIVLGSVSMSGCSSQEGTGASSSTDATKSSAGDAGSSTTTTGTGTTADSTSDPNATKEPEKAPIADAPKDGDDVAVLETSMGKIVIMFYPDRAPLHVENFMNLAKEGFYNGTRFHRCIAGFMIQGGDPLSKNTKDVARWGTGGNMKDGKEVTVRAEFNDIHHAKGIVSMARSADPNSASSQFFIMVGDSPQLDGQYSAFGKVVSGQDVADKIVATGDPAQDGKVDPDKAVLLKSVKLAKWPVR